MTMLDEYTEYTKAVQETAKKTAAHQLDQLTRMAEMKKGLEINLIQPRLKSAQAPPAVMPLGFSTTEQLGKMIGLASVKQAVASIANQMRFDRQRRSHGLPGSSQAQHFIFTGNPGTGKTTVARLLGKIMYEEGYLKSGHVVECHAQDLISQWVGATAPQVMSCVQRALGGVLFIDEAYGLLGHVGIKNNTTNQAITALLGAMENYRDQFTVIAAGYPAEMKSFVESNPGLKSRFNRFIAFDDYDAAELEQIFNNMAETLCYKVDTPAYANLKWAMERAQTVFAQNFPNGRFVRNLFESTLRNMANRLERRIGHGGGLSRSDMTIIKACDIDAAWDEMLHTPQ